MKKSWMQAIAAIMAAPAITATAAVLLKTNEWKLYRETFK